MSTTQLVSIVKKSGVSKNPHRVVAGLYQFNHIYGVKAMHMVSFDKDGKCYYVFKNEDGFFGIVEENATVSDTLYFEKCLINQLKQL